MLKAFRNVAILATVVAATGCASAQKSFPSTAATPANVEPVSTAPDMSVRTNWEEIPFEEWPIPENLTALVAVILKEPFTEEDERWFEEKGYYVWRVLVTLNQLRVFVDDDFLEMDHARALPKIQDVVVLRRLKR